LGPIFAAQPAELDISVRRQRASPASWQFFPCCIAYPPFLRYTPFIHHAKLTVKDKGIGMKLFYHEVYYYIAYLS
jgi:hypothetical protein